MLLWVRAPVSSLDMKRWFWILDTAVVMSFVIIGRDTHGFVPDWGDTMRVAAPFLIALAIGIVASRAWRTPTRVTTGLLLVATVVVVGMVLRRNVFDAGTARTFVIFTTAWMTAWIVGWRLVAALVSRARDRGRSAPSERSGATSPDL